jgi:2'-5' RNA ligase
LASDWRRLFLALWPDGAVRSRLESIPAGIAASGRRIPARNLHLTLAFLGSLDPAAQRCVEEAAQTVRARPCTLLLDEVGWFRRPRVLWVGASQVPAQLEDLVEQLSERLTPCGYAPDSRPFRAHVTLARKVDRGPLRREAIAPIEWHVDGFALVESVMLPAGADYRPLRIWSAA